MAVLALPLGRKSKVMAKAKMAKAGKAKAGKAKAAQARIPMVRVQRLVATLAKRVASRFGGRKAFPKWSLAA
jgi:hypothetical protein